MAHHLTRMTLDNSQFKDRRAVEGNKFLLARVLQTHNLVKTQHLNEILVYHQRPKKLLIMDCSLVVALLTLTALNQGIPINHQSEVEQSTLTKVEIQILLVIVQTQTGPFSYKTIIRVSEVERQLNFLPNNPLNFQTFWTIRTSTFLVKKDKKLRSFKMV